MCLLLKCLPATSKINMLKKLLARFKWDVDSREIRITFFISISIYRLLILFQKQTEILKNVSYVLKK